MPSSFNHNSFNRKALALFCLFAFQCRQLSAATATVTDFIDDGTAGSLRGAIAQVNADPVGPNTISWTPGVGGTIALVGDLPSINDGTKLDVTAAGSTVIIANGYAMPLGGQVTFMNDNVTFNWGISAVLTGPGSLVKTGAGLLTLAGADTYAGGTTINRGTLAINADAALGVASSSVTFNGGGLRANAALASLRGMTLMAGGGTIDTNSFQMSMGGIITGVGGLTKAGAGTLVLSGANNYTGGTTISSGTLQAGGDNVLPAGALTVTSGAVLDLAGTTQINPLSYGGGGTLRVMLKPGFTNLALSGAANLSGPLEVHLSPQVIHQGDTFTPVTYGSFTGTFSNIISPVALAFDPAYSGDSSSPGSLLLTARFIPFANSAVTKNQQSVADGLESLRTAPTGDAATVIENLYTLDGPQLRSAFDQIGPLSLATVRGLGLVASKSLSEGVDNRVDALIRGVDPDGTAAGRIAGRDSPWGFFASGVGGRALLRQDAEAPETSYESRGVLAGLDYSGAHFAVGAAGGYLLGTSSIASSTGTDTVANTGRGVVDEKSLRYGLYGAAYGDRFRANAYAGAAGNHFSTKRTVNFADIARTAEADPRGGELNLHTDAAYALWQERWGNIFPAVGLDYDRFREGSFTENGADSLDLSVQPQSEASLRSNLRIEYAAEAVLSAYKLGTKLSAGWRHEFEASKTVASQLATGSGTTLSVSPLDFGRDGFLLGLGVYCDLGKTFSIQIDYAGDYSARVTDQRFGGGVHLKF